MDAQSWVRLNRLLDDALDLSPAERELWLSRLNPDDEPLKPRIVALLARAPSIQAASFLGALPRLDVGAIDPVDLPDPADPAIAGLDRLTLPGTPARAPRSARRDRS